MVVIKLLESIFNFGSSIVNAVAARRRRQQENRIAKLKKKKEDEEAGQIASMKKTENEKQSFDSQRELSHRP